MAAPPPAAEQHRCRRTPPPSKHWRFPGARWPLPPLAGSIHLFNDKGEPQADIAFTAYQLDGADAHTRPVTFFFNGGPGAASAYLQLGGHGTLAAFHQRRRRRFRRPPPDLQPNAETWLDFTDQSLSIPSAPATALRRDRR